MWKKWKPLHLGLKSLLVSRNCSQEHNPDVKWDEMRTNRTYIHPSLPPTLTMMVKWKEPVLVAMELHIHLPLDWVAEGGVVGLPAAPCQQDGQQLDTVHMDVVTPCTHADLWSKTAAPQSSAILWMLWLSMVECLTSADRLMLGLITSDELQVSSLTLFIPATFSVWLSFLIFYRLLGWTKKWHHAGQFQYLNHLLL